MATISHPAFRILLEKFGGCDEYFTEMINAGTLITGGQFEKYYIDPAPVPQKVVWQLTGKNCEQMVAAAKMLVELPGIGIDLNMGCSAPDIYRFGSGIAWMIKPLEETQEMVRGVGSVIKEYNATHQNKLRYSVKLRLGDDDYTDEKFFGFCQMLVNNGVELLTLHPRTKKEKLTRPTHYEYCQKLAQIMHPQGVQVYLNGNVKDKASFDYAVSKAPDVDGIMISRAAVSNPWIFAELSRNCKVVKCSDAENTDVIDLQQLAYDYISDIETYQPVEFWKTRLQRFFAYYAENFQFSHYAQTQFLNAADNQDLRDRIQLFFEKCPEERFRMFVEN